MNDLSKVKITLKNLPQKPGVYQFYDSTGKLLYVGKAKNLKNRVKSYFQKNSEHTIRIQKMISQIANIKYTITNTEIESLALENNFIKELKPKYNIDLKDDKNYLFIKINYSHKIPSIETERKISDKNSVYFGPYSSAQNVKQILRLIHKIFPFCTNKTIGTKPCFYYHIGKCPGICIGKITLKEYQETLDKISKFLRGQYNDLIKTLTHQMLKFSKQQNFEKAGALRDQIQTLEKTWMQQSVILPKNVSWDVFSLFSLTNSSCINLFIVRTGKVIRKESFVLHNTSQFIPSEIFEQFLTQYYNDSQNFPKEIITSHKINDHYFYKTFRKIKIIQAYRGKKAHLIQLGKKNAEEYLKSTLNNQELENAKTYAALKQIQQTLKLFNFPARIECFDISNTSGTNATGSMVVFNYGRPDKSQYRKFKIKTKSTPDDFAMMSEVLTRRFSHSFPNSKFQILNSTPWPLPDLILIDGGKGQLSAALKALHQIPNSKFQIPPIIAIAKRLEEIYQPLNHKPLTLPPNSPALFLLQRIRDEAHRFAVTYHRKLRANSAVSSILDQIPGLGAQKKKKLLLKFRSISVLRSANLTDLGNIVGRKLAEIIKAKL